MCKLMRYKPKLNKIFNALTRAYEELAHASRQRAGRR